MNGPELVERIIAARDTLKKLNIADYAIIADTRDVLADAANALDSYDKTMRVIAKQSALESVAMVQAQKALAAWDRYEPTITSDGITEQANDMANAIRSVLATRDPVETV